MRLTLSSLSLPIATIGFIPFEQPLDDLAGLWTIERPWCDNQRNVSCIPSGFYALEPYSSEAYPETWALVGEGVSLHEEPTVPRFTCLFHVANFARNVEGCIGPGIEAVSMLDSQVGAVVPAVASSAAAMAVLRKLLAGEDRHYLRIVRGQRSAASW